MGPSRYEPVEIIRFKNQPQHNNFEPSQYIEKLNILKDYH